MHYGRGEQRIGRGPQSEANSSEKRRQFREVRAPLIIERAQLSLPGLARNDANPRYAGALAYFGDAGTLAVLVWPDD